MAIAAQVFLIGRDDARTFDRIDVVADGTVRTDQATPHDAVVHNISLGGCRLETTATLSVGDTLSLGISGVPRTQAVVTRGQDGFYACAFPIPLSALDVTALGRDTLASIAASPATAHAVERKFPLAARAAVIFGGAAVLWVAIIGTIAAAV